MAAVKPDDEAPINALRKGNRENLAPEDMPNQKNPFPIITVRENWVIEDEPMGSKAKFWVQLPNDSQPWLFKYSRVNAGIVTGEHWAEKLAAEFAGLLDVPHAEVELAKFGDFFGCLSREFEDLANPRVELVHGNELLAGFVEG
jgi:hypothetical protein